MSGRNFDYPKPLRGRMAKNALREMAQHASTLDKDLQDDDKLPAWVDYYIATSSDRMNTVGNYMQGEIKRFQASSPAQQQSYGGFGYDTQVMMRDYGVDNRGYGDLAYSGFFEDALDKLSDAVSDDDQTQERVRSVGRILAIVYLASMPLAAGIAYYRSQSVPQALGAGLASTPYLLYVAANALFKK